MLRLSEWFQKLVVKICNKNEELIEKVFAREELKFL